MQPDVFGTGERFEVRRLVVQSVAVDVVNDVPSGKRPVGKLPRDDRSGTPHVRFRHLDPCARVVSPVRANSDGSHPRLVVRGSRAELRRGGAPHSPGRGFEVPRPLRRAGIRAVVDGTQLRRLAMELVSAHGAGEVRGPLPRTPERRTFLLSAGSRAEQQSALVAGEAVGLDLESGAATGTRRINHDWQFTSETTLAVAS